jgi:tetratricopeptide (TPR) repeat protein
VKKLFCIFPFLIFRLFVNAQSVQQYLDNGKQFIADRNEESALQQYLAALKIDPANYEALWNASFLYSKIGFRQNDDDKKKQNFNLAKQFAIKALQVDSSEAKSNFVMAVAMGRMALISGAKDKVSASRDIKRYIDKSIKLDPDYADSYSVLGRWHYEMANLNFIERTFANWFFGGLPTGASVDNAIVNYKKAISLDPTYILYYHDLAIAYHNIDQNDAALKTLRQALTLKVRTEDDPSWQSECQKMLSDWQ